MKAVRVLFMLLASLTSPALAGTPATAPDATKAAAPAPAAPTMTLAPVKDLKWQPLDPKNPGGLQVSLVSGDMYKGPTSFFLKMPPGSRSPGHTHSNDYYGVVIAGNPGHGLTSEAASTGQAVGSTWYQPGKQVHFDNCSGTAECVIYLVYPGGGFDFQMAK
ncbi:MAG: hypothetical protein ACKO6N_07970 [Myxococcota bacterium]